MVTQLEVGDVAVDVLRKDIKNVHLSVHPPTGRVRISAPVRMSLDTLRVFAISKLDWIKQHQRTQREQERESPREYLERESHYVWGQRYLLQVRETDEPPRVALAHSKMILFVRPQSSVAKKHAVVEAWYRCEVRLVVPVLIKKWEPRLGVRVARFFVQRMKTKWGSCSPGKHSLRLNTDLARKPRECLEYIVVHEMVHLLEPTHNARFIALMDRFMPRWQFHRAELNRWPVRQENWTY